MIGATPVVKAQRIDAGLCELYFKLESRTRRSIKDRIGLKMIEAAEARGDIAPGDTSWRHCRQHRHRPGLVAQQKGYKLILVCPTR